MPFLTPIPRHLDFPIAMQTLKVTVLKCTLHTEHLDPEPNYISEIDLQGVFKKAPTFVLLIFQKKS